MGFPDEDMSGFLCKNPRKKELVSETHTPSVARCVCERAGGLIFESFLKDLAVVSGGRGRGLERGGGSRGTFRLATHQYHMAVPGAVDIGRRPRCIVHGQTAFVEWRQYMSRVGHGT